MTNPEDAAQRDKERQARIERAIEAAVSRSPERREADDRLRERGIAPGLRLTMAFLAQQKDRTDAMGRPAPERNPNRISRAQDRTRDLRRER